MAIRVSVTEFGSMLAAKFGSEVRVGEVRPFAKEQDVQVPSAFWATPKVRRGVLDISDYAGNAAVAAPAVTASPAVEQVAGTEAQVVQMPAANRSFAVATAEHTEVFAPEKDPLYIRWGIHSRIQTVIQKRIFFPIFVTGLSGNGKTMMIEQACAQAKRKLVRVNFTVETDEDDLIGGFRMDNGTTYWKDGPVITAMREGAVLLLDEISFGGARITALQSILEGKGYFIKKTGEFVKPTKGFTVIAADNTKGKGSEDGRFAFTNVLNEAFLERFKMWFHQPYPTKATETKILKRLMEYKLREVGEEVKEEDTEFVSNLVSWGDITRKTFEDGAIDDLITTRRLVGVIEAYTIFDRDRGFSVAAATERFDTDTKEAFMDLYSKIDSGVDPESISMTGESEEAESSISF